ncbi:MAG: hypothetical protein ACYTFD_16005 [Planctomycetota bacterium]|jgi:hypothetical protein
MRRHPAVLALLLLVFPVASCRPSGELSTSETRQPETEHLNRAVAIGLAESADARRPGGEYRLVGARQVLVDGKYVWRITFKPCRLLPDDPSTQKIGLGGEIFMNVDLETEVATIGYGE